MTGQSASVQHVHVVGAGVAGLAAAVSLTERGIPVTLHEAGPAAGGRCRSYFDRELGCRLDNGNHLLLSGNRATMAYLDRIGSRDTLTGPATPAFPFADLATGERWTVRPSRGRLPFWIFRRSRRVPGTRAAEYLALLRLRMAKPDATVSDALRPGPLRHRLLDPLAIAALNTMPEQGSARLLDAVVRETLGEGGAACLARFPREGLSESFVDPALHWLEAAGANIRLASRVRDLTFAHDRVVAIDETPLADRETIVLAVPPPVASALLPGLVAPDTFESIANLHFRIDADPGEAGFIGVIGGRAEWIFVKPGVVSVTISAANRFADVPGVALAQQVWQEVASILRLRVSIPPHRVVWERRATFAATPAQDRRRPPARTAFTNLVLAGDWTQTGLPATIEGAIRSGRRAADTVCEVVRQGELTEDA